MWESSSLELGSLRRVRGSKGLKVDFPKTCGNEACFQPTVCSVGDITRAYFEWILIEWLFGCRICRGAVSVCSAEAPLPGSECQWHEGID